MINTLIAKIFGDPSEKKLKSYTKELEKIKVIEAQYRDEISTVEQIQAKTHEFQTRFDGLSIDKEGDLDQIRSILESTKYEAFALHRRACEIIYGQEFAFASGDPIKWNMIPYDVQLIG